ncbi:MAG: FxLYD domain-containing protein, partial [Anaerolineae bacterium]
GVEGGVSGPQYRVTGLLVNDSEVAVQRITVVVTLYDEEGRVNAYRQTVLGEQTLSAGARSEFSLLLTPHGRATPSSFQVLAWGSRVG